MIRTIQELTNNTFSNYSDISTDRPNSPNLGDIFYDTSIGRIFVFDSGKWKQLNVYSKDVFLNRKRKNKIKNIFNEV